MATDLTLDKRLEGRKILITRPKQQAKKLCELVNDTGGEAISFPVIDIEPILHEKWDEHDLEKQDFIIFISRNAVSNFIDGIAGILPERSLLVAIGAGTAQSMIAHDLRVNIQPNEQSGAKGLLAMTELESVAEKNILIVRGKGGRELLADSLAARGAKISYIEVYERVLASPTETQCQQALEADYVVCTSVKGIENLCILLKRNINRLLEKPMVVVSERIKHKAELLGFQHVVVTAEVSDESIVQHLIEMEK